jgi:hypothetical protein
VGCDVALQLRISITPLAALLFPSAGRPGRVGRDERTLQELLGAHQIAFRGICGCTNRSGAGATAPDLFFQGKDEAQTGVYGRLQDSMYTFKYAPHKADPVVLKDAPLPLPHNKSETRTLFFANLRSPARFPAQPARPERSYAWYDDPPPPPPPPATRALRFSPTLLRSALFEVACFTKTGAVAPKPKAVLGPAAAQKPPSGPGAAAAQKPPPLPPPVATTEEDEQPLALERDRDNAEERIGRRQVRALLGDSEGDAIEADGEWAAGAGTAGATVAAPALPVADVPEGLRADVVLRPYQRCALAWMLNRESRRPLAPEALAALVPPGAVRGAARAAATDAANTDSNSSLSGSGSGSPAGTDADVPASVPGASEVAFGSASLWEPYTLPPDDSGAGGATLWLNPVHRTVALRAPRPPRPTRGGILGDEMGLGKSLELIALCAAQKERRLRREQQRRHTAGAAQPQSDESDSGSSSDEDPDGYDSSAGRNKGKRAPNKGLTRVHTTLIVTPTSLLGQWQREIRRFSTLRCFVHYGCDRLGTAEQVAGFDVVLTTYGVLGVECSPTRTNVFSSVRWERVALDESHMIRNRSTATARACFHLEARWRWALSGTPIVNSLQDLFAILAFLRSEPWGLLSWWRAVVAERAFYDALYHRSKLQFQGYVMSGNLMHAYAQVLNLLLRLRQSCLHPFMVIDSLQKAATVTNAAAATSAQLLALRPYDRKEEETAPPASVSVTSSNDGVHTSSTDSPAGADAGELSSAFLEKLYTKLVAARMATDSISSTGAASRLSQKDKKPDGTANASEQLLQRSMGGAIGRESEEGLPEFIKAQLDSFRETRAVNGECPVCFGELDEHVNSKSTGTTGKQQIGNKGSSNSGDKAVRATSPSSLSHCPSPSRIEDPIVHIVPVILSCGHVMCEACARDVLSRTNSCPVCNTAFDVWKKHMFPLRGRASTVPVQPKPTPPIQSRSRATSERTPVAVAPVPVVTTALSSRKSVMMGTRSLPLSSKLVTLMNELRQIMEHNKKATAQELSDIGEVQWANGEPRLGLLRRSGRPWETCRSAGGQPLRKRRRHFNYLSLKFTDAASSSEEDAEVNAPEKVGADTSVEGDPDADADVVSMVNGMRLEESVRVVIFSFFTFFLDILQQVLEREGIRFARLDGSMSKARRDSELAAFRDPISRVSVMLMSLKAGALGLNLQNAASIVYLCDPWWAPSVEKQAISRVHRLGQTKQVYVRRLITAESVEENMLEIQRRKDKLTDALDAVQQDGISTTKLTEEDLRLFFSR